MCRYNLSIANSAISKEFGFSKADMGAIITTALLAYACGQIINGFYFYHAWRVERLQATSHAANRYEESKQSPKRRGADIGGAKMACFASGVVDSFQYFGGSRAGYFLGSLLDKSWGSYFYFMAPVGLIGGLLMMSILGRVTLSKLRPTLSSE
jgi:sugar phosphate permease